MVLDRSTRYFAENTCSARAEDPRSTYLEPISVLKGNGPRTYPFGQCRCGVIWHIGLCTPPLPVVCWYWVFRVHKLLPQDPDGKEDNLDR